jgi:hypothetical protein
MDNGIAINTDILIHMCCFSSNRTILNLLSCSNMLHKSKKNVLFNGNIWIGTDEKYNKINKLWYFDNFTNVSCHPRGAKIPSNIINLTFNYRNHGQIPEIDIPDRIQKITFMYGWFANTLPKKSFQFLTHIIFGPDVNQVLEVGILPQSLTHLELGEHFDQFLEPGVFPQLLTYLKFGERFGQLIRPGVFPQSLTYLIFGIRFNQLIGPDVLPISLIHLEFGKWYDQPIVPGVLPESIICLIFGDYFNQPIKNILGSNVEKLTLGKLFNQKIRKKYMPQSLKYITLCNPKYIDMDYSFKISKANRNIQYSHMILDVF